MHEESRWYVDSWNALRGLPWDVNERGVEVTEAFLKLHELKSSICF